MADEADVANDYQAKWLAAQLEEHSYQMSHPAVTFEAGRCRNCEERLDDGRTFCDTDCATDFETRLRASRRNGRTTSE